VSGCGSAPWQRSADSLVLPAPARRLGDGECAKPKRLRSHETTPDLLAYLATLALARVFPKGDVGTRLQGKDLTVGRG